MPLLTASHLTKQFGPVLAVNDVSLEVDAGEVVGLLGPNGAGKTTTLRMLAGILTPTSGQVSLGGAEMSAQALEAKRRMGFLTGDTQLYQRLTPREVLGYFGRLYGVAEPKLRDRVEALVEELDMADYADRPCRSLSSGQKQRANIARAFVHEPEVLILDEPTSALDVVSGRFIVEAVRRQREAGRAILLSTHIMSEADYLCDRIYIMLGGRVADSGTKAELLGRAACANLTDTLFHHLNEKSEIAA